MNLWAQADMNTAPLALNKYDAQRRGYNVNLRGYWLLRLYDTFTFFQTPFSSFQL